MRINYYRFPDDNPEHVMLEEGCEVVLKNGDTLYVSTIPDDKRESVDYINTTIGGLKVSSVKELIKKYGGCGWTDHC